MPHFRVDDALHSHPKAQRAGDDAMGMWVRAGSFCMAYLTDGFVPEWWVKQQPNGTRKAKKLVNSGLWNDGAEHDGEKGYQFHEFVGQGRQDSREQIEADRERWRKKKAGQRAMSPGDTNGDTPPMSPGDTPGESPRESSYARVTPARANPTQPQQEKNTGYVPEVSALNVDPPRSAERGLSEPATASASRIVHATLHGTYPAAVMATLRIKASELMNRDGLTAEALTETIRRWEAKPDVGPNALPMFAAEAIKATTAATNGLAPGEAKVAGWAALGQPDHHQEAIER